MPNTRVAKITFRTRDDFQKLLRSDYPKSGMLYCNVHSGPDIDPINPDIDPINWVLDIREIYPNSFFDINNSDRNMVNTLKAMGILRYIHKITDSRGEVLYVNPNPVTGFVVANEPMNFEEIPDLNGPPLYIETTPVHIFSSKNSARFGNWLKCQLQTWFVDDKSGILSFVESKSLENICGFFTNTSLETRLKDVIKAVKKQENLRSERISSNVRAEETKNEEEISDECSWFDIHKAILGQDCIKNGLKYFFGKGSISMEDRILFRILFGGYLGVDARSVLIPIYLLFMYWRIKYMVPPSSDEDRLIPDILRELKSWINIVLTFGFADGVKALDLLRSTGLIPGKVRKKGHGFVTLDMTHIFVILSIFCKAYNVECPNNNESLRNLWGNIINCLFDVIVFPCIPVPNPQTIGFVEKNSICNVCLEHISKFFCPECAVRSCSECLENLKKNPSRCGSHVFTESEYFRKTDGSQPFTSKYSNVKDIFKEIKTKLFNSSRLESSRPESSRQRSCESSSSRPESSRQRSYGSSSSRQMSSRPGSYGQMPYGQMSYGQMPYGQMSYGQMPYGSGSYGSGSYGQMPYGSGSYGQMPYGSGSYESGSYGQMPYGSGSYGSGSYGQMPYGSGSYGSGSYGQMPYGSGSYGPSYSRPGSYGQIDSMDEQMPNGPIMTVVWRGIPGSGKSGCAKMIKDFLLKMSYKVFVISFDDIFFECRGNMKKVVKKIQNLMREANDTNDGNTILILDTCGSRSDSDNEFFGFSIINPVEFVPNINSCYKNPIAFLGFCTENVSKRTGKRGLTSDNPNYKNVILKKYRELVKAGVYPKTDLSKEVTSEELERFKKELPSLHDQVFDFLINHFPQYHIIIGNCKLENFR